ncbi:DUF3578 domain-containing protein [Bacillus pumilus]|nr:DUF3578 domain-containing protein [Bacillus pumilus]
MEQNLFNIDYFYEQFLDYKKNVKTDKNHPFHNLFKEEIPHKIRLELEKLHLRNMSRIDIKASTGSGKIAEAIWIAFLDPLLTMNPRTKRTTTQKGVYIVMLFAENGKDFFLTIGLGTENLSLQKIKEEADVWRKRIKSQVEYHPHLNGFEIGDFYLGESDRPKKYVAGSLVFKRYHISTFNQQQFLKDIYYLNDFFYDFIFEIYSTPVFSMDSNDKKSIKRKRIIHRDVYKQLREERAKQNEETGRIAEKYVYEVEVEKLLEAGQVQLAKSVHWVAETEDGHGYDIKSFYPDGTEKLIEVKGSKLTHQEFQFFLSEQERVVAAEEGEAYVITLVEGVGTQNMNIIKEIQNPMGKENLLLKPTQYSCKIRVD